MNRTRVLVAEPLTIFRAGVRNLLMRESDLDVVEAANFEEVGACVDCGCPDLALIDLDLPPIGGVEAVKLLSQRCSTRCRRNSSASW